MDVRLDGRVLVVTGSTQGVGEAIAVLAAESGAEGLVITGRNRERGEAVRAKLAGLGSRAVFVEADLGAPDAPERIVAAGIETFGRVDGLVNAAALTDRGSLDEATPELWDRLFAVNARAPFFLTQLVARDLKRRGAPGGVVNILSVNAHCGAPDLSVYSGSKGALTTLTRNHSNALLRDRIRVNGIYLGWTLTPAEQVMQSETLGKGPGWAEEAAARMPFGRLLTPEDVAELAVFLLSDNSSLMTGALIDLEQAVVGAPQQAMYSPGT